MRVLWVLSKLDWGGGIGRVAEGTLRALTARGHDVHAAGALPRGKAEIAPLDGVQVYPWPKRRMKVMQIPDLARVVRRVRPDVVHFHSALPHGEEIAALRALRRGRDRPRIVVTPHTSRRVTYPKRRSRLGLRVPDAVVCVSRWSAGHAQRAGAHADRLHVVYNGIDAVGSVTPPEEREPWILFLARLLPVKGADVLVDAFDRVAAKYPAWRLRIGGDGRALPALRTQLGQCANGSRIELLGRVSGSPKDELLARSAIGAVPSLEENFPGTLLEFQANGLACVASDVGGIPEMAEGGKATVLVPPRDPVALASALDALMSDPARRAELSHRARRASPDRSWDAAARGYEDVYRGLLGEDS